MRIVNLTTFLTLPAGTVYAKFAPDYFEHWGIKEGSLPRDFIYQTLEPHFEGDGGSADWSDTLDRLVEGGSAAVEFDCCGRDGSFEDGQLFAVLDRQDTERLIRRLQKALADAGDLVRFADGRVFKAL